ncbi:AIR synthase-related protein, partial [Streptomyces bambusae]
RAPYDRVSGPGGVRAARTVGRGGLAAALHAYARELGRPLRVEEEALPVQYEARMALEAMAVDPLHTSSDSCLCLLVAPGAVDAVLAALRAHPYGRAAAVVGEVAAAAPGGDGAWGPAQASRVDLVRGDGSTVPLTPDPATPARLT